jgi:exodeoxyribonuclease V alpha subunit
MKNKLTGFFKREIFRNKDNEYTVGIVQVLTSDLDIKTLKKYSDRGQVTIVGFLPQLLIDEEYHFYGEFFENNYGMQFKVDTYEIEMKNDRRSLIDFLSSDLFKGIGRVLARRIVDELGDNAVDKIIANKNCLMDIVGMTENKAEQLFEGLLVNYSSEKIIRFLMEHGFGTKVSKKIFKHYKQTTIESLSENPYRLIDDIEGVGFKRADQFAASLGYDMKSKNRIQASIKHVFLELCYSEGYTFIYEEQLLNQSQSFLNQSEFRLTPEDILMNIEELILNKQIVKEDNRLYLKTLYEAETNVANRIFQISNLDVETIQAENEILECINEIEKEYGITYTSKQKEAIITALNHKVTVLTGGPGTGKTTVVNGIIQSYKRLNGLNPSGLIDKLALVAPTGRAAKRLQETTTCEAKTIHRLLGYDGAGNLTYNEHNKVNQSLIICDESSMIDISLASHLLSALNNEVQIIFVGDVNQLPSVGPGEVLKDIIGSKVVETITLDKIHRQKNQSTIIELAHDINQEVISPNLLDKQHDRNFIVSNHDQILNRLEFIIKNALDKKFSIENIQILAPMYKGPVGIDQINLHMQEVINPKEEGKKEYSHYNRIFRQGDKVIQLVNRPTEYVMNGDIGFISHIFEESNDENIRLVVTYDEIEVNYTDNELDQLSLAYSISIHKSQGSEFDIVIVVLSKSYHVMLRKKLIYTAVTRAKKSLILIGDPRAYAIAVQNSRETLRQTTLKERFQNLFKNKAILFDGFEFKIPEIGLISPYDFL